MIKRMIIMLLAVGVVLGGVFGFQAFKNDMIKKFMSAAWARRRRPCRPTVAAMQDWQPQIEAVGSLRAVNGADLSLEVAGIVDEIRFNSGDDVRGRRSSWSAARR